MSKGSAHKLIFDQGIFFEYLFYLMFEKIMSSMMAKEI